MWCTFSTSLTSSMSCSASSSSTLRPSRKTRFSLGLDQIRISRAVSPGVTHPRLKRTFWPVLSSGRRFWPRHAPPPQANFCHWRPDSALSPGCSPLTSGRGRFAPDSATKSRPRPLRHQTPFPVHPRHCKKRLADWRPSVAPPCRRSFSAVRSFTLSGEGCDQAQRSKHNEENILALKSRPRWAGRLIPPATLRSRQSIAGRHAPPHRTAFSARFPIGPRFWAASCTPTSIAFSRFRPNWGLSKKCSQLTSGRESIYTCFSFAATRLTCHLQNSVSCTPPIHRGESRFPGSLEVMLRRVGRAGEGVEDPPQRPTVVASTQPHFLRSHSFVTPLNR